MISYEKINKHIAFHFPFLDPEKLTHIQVGKGNIDPVPQEGWFFTYTTIPPANLNLLFGPHLQITNSIKQCNCSNIPEDERWPNPGYFKQGMLARCGPHDHNSSVLSPKVIWKLNHGWNFDGVLTFTNNSMKEIAVPKKCQHEFIPLFTTVCCKHCGIEKC